MDGGRFLFMRRKHPSQSAPPEWEPRGMMATGVTGVTGEPLRPFGPAPLGRGALGAGRPEGRTPQALRASSP